MIAKQDIVIVISKSGESSEFSDLLLYCSRFTIPVIAIAANARSNISEVADHLLLLSNLP
jgi:arabinose-5-phosphate isomerase